MDSIFLFERNTKVFPVTPANNGSDRETIDSIKFQAPKAYASRGRAVTKDDYMTILQQNTLGYVFDAVNVWGGEENIPPEYGKVKIVIKPKNTASLSVLGYERENPVIVLWNHISFQKNSG